MDVAGIILMLVTVWVVLFMAFMFGVKTTMEDKVLVDEALKIECEVELPRNQNCVAKFVVEVK